MFGMMELAQRIITFCHQKQLTTYTQVDLSCGPLSPAHHSEAVRVEMTTQFLWNEVGCSFLRRDTADHYFVMAS